MIDLKPYGAFLEHTIRPLIDELKPLIEKSGLKITEDTIRYTLVKSIQYKILEVIGQLIGTGVVCLTAYLIVK